MANLLGDTLKGLTCIIGSIAAAFRAPAYISQAVRPEFWSSPLPDEAKRLAERTRPQALRTVVVSGESAWRRRRSSCTTLPG